MAQDWTADPGLRGMLHDFQERPEFQHPAEFSLSLAMRLVLAERQAAGVADPLAEGRPLADVLRDLVRLAGAPAPTYLEAADPIWPRIVPGR